MRIVALFLLLFTASMSGDQPLRSLHAIAKGYDPRRCSNENEMLISKGASQPRLPICKDMLSSVALAKRSTQDGPVSMQDSDGSACTFQWFNETEICALLSEPPTTIIYIGDSITRHAMHGMQLLVRDNIELGALRSVGARGLFCEARIDVELLFFQGRSASQCIRSLHMQPAVHH